METNIFDIERYFEGSMTAGEIAEFENRRQTDKAFAKEVMLYEQAKSVIRHAANLRMKEHLDHLGKSQISVATVGTFMKYRIMKRQWMAIAASVLLLAGAFFTVRQVMFSTPASLSSLYGEYYSTPGADLLVSRNSESTSELETKAIEYYSNRQYKEAAGSFRALLDEPAYSRTSAAGFYLGICYLNLNMPERAISSFNMVSEGSSFGNDALWYKGMAFILKGDKENARIVFKSIAENRDHPRKSDANKISRALSRNK